MREVFINLLNGPKDEGLWILNPEAIDVRVEQPKPTILEPDVRIPESIAYARKIQLDCLRMMRTGKQR